MPKFETKYIHVKWSDELDGKHVFFADHSLYLKERVENNDIRYYKEVTRGGSYLPFRTRYTEECWKFCYYDPYYDLKVALEQGKVIQVDTSEWKDLLFPVWDLNPERYRIKPEEPDESKPVTNRELARWLAQGNGEYYEYDCDGWESHRCIEYQYEQDNLPVSNVMVRKWEDEEWHEPTREYLGL